MIYFKTADQSFIVLEPGNIDKIKTGEPLCTPDKSIAIAYCPDINWLSNKLMEILEGNELDVEAFDALLKEGLTRNPVRREGTTMKVILPKQVQ